MSSVNFIISQFLFYGPGCPIHHAFCDGWDCTTLNPPRAGAPGASPLGTWDCGCKMIAVCPIHHAFCDGWDCTTLNPPGDLPSPSSLMSHRCSQREQVKIAPGETRGNESPKRLRRPVGTA